jgi:hypothetical protein
MAGPAVYVQGRCVSLHDETLGMRMKTDRLFNVRKWVVLGVALVSLLVAAGAVALSNPTVDVEEADAGGPGKGQLKHAASISAAFDIDSDTALALHRDGLGWGAMVKLLAIAEVSGVSVDQLLANVDKVDGEYEFDFGSMRAGLTASQQEELARMPKGIGQLGHSNGIPPGLAKKLDTNDGS